MAIPTYEQVMIPFLRALSDGQTRPLRELYDELANAFQLTEEERDRRLPSGQQRVLHNRIGWARTHLKKAGLIETPKRGWLHLTDEGRKVLNEQPDGIGSKFLDRYESYREFKEPKERLPESESVVESVESSSTPDEVIEAAYQLHRGQVASDLLETVKKCSPYFFEKVVLRLLQGMGYGGVSGRGLVTPKSGDGGIDGIIYEDKLGLDNVCIQAKRWEGVVGRRTVQEFAGSMDLHRSRKGVILTTSHFSQDALEYVERIEAKKVVLIDGEELTRLMLEYRVGVTTSKNFELLDISQDFFDEDT